MVSKVTAGSVVGAFKMEIVDGLEDFKRWNIDALRKFCRNRGLKITQCRNKEELVASACSADSYAFFILC
jgi:hypothetical protein